MQIKDGNGYVVSTTFESIFDVERSNLDNVGVHYTGDVGFDVKAVTVEKLKPKNFFDRIFPIYQYGTGVHLAQPDNLWALLAPRSSASKVPGWFANSVGIIDTGYTGEIICRYRGLFLTGSPYKVGERVGQLIFIPKVGVTNYTGNGKRSSSNFGSSGK